MDSIAWLEEWFSAQCDGDWEHARGISVTTLDNPGWLVTVDLAGTRFEKDAQDAALKVVGAPPSHLNGNVGGPDWMRCEIVGGQYKGAGDPKKLRLIVEQFRGWATRDRR